ncbi:PEP-CTERM sorting domain-containing protein [Rhodoferax sp. WC2427]|uniref:PEP-CTERM sorting domain-containing protein n=1 Tax=Rhodoferax sp. WC2427 TaxID=3234144 RepID=UPI00346553D4
MAVNAHAAPVLHIDAGQLMGAMGVAVNGVQYNVQFQDGTCASLFSGCDAYADFPFQTRHDAVAASQALLAGVFIDTAQGQFASNPALTNGCGDAQFCQVFTPYPFTPEGFLSFAIALNFDAASQMPDAIEVLVTNRPFGDTTDITGYTYAVWSLVSASEVPEPSTVWLVGAMLLLAAGRRAGKNIWIDIKSPLN